MFEIITKEWFDKVNGNTYFATRIYNNDKLLGTIPFQYGYGDTSQHTALSWLHDNGHTSERRDWANCKFEKRIKCLKRDVKAWGE